MTALQEKQSNILNAKQAIYELTNENTQINEKIYKLNVVKDALIKDLNTLMEKIPKDKQYTEEIESKIEFRKGKIEKYRAEIEEVRCVYVFFSELIEYFLTVFFKAKTRAIGHESHSRKHNVQIWKSQRDECKIERTNGWTERIWRSSTKREFGQFKTWKTQEWNCE